MAGLVTMTAFDRFYLYLFGIAVRVHSLPHVYKVDLVASFAIPID